MPMGQYRDFDDCVRKNRNKKNPKAYCGAIKAKVEAELRDGDVTNKLEETRAYEVFENIGAAEFNEDGDKLQAKITILREGRSKNRRYYSKQVLREAVAKKTFDNMRMFVDHSSTPPLKRSLREMVSATGDTAYEEDAEGGKITSTATFFSKDFFDFAKRAKEHMGDSLAARLRVTRRLGTDGHVEEQVHNIMKGYSVDWVVFPSAGGGIEQFITEGAEGEDSVEWSELTPEMLKEHAPDLYTELTAREDEDDDEEKPDGDGDGNGKDDDDSEESISSLTAAGLGALIDKKVNEGIEAFKADEAAKAEAAERTATLVDATSLPEPTKARIKKSFADKGFSESDVKESIEEAKEELKAAGAGPKVTGMGVTAASGGTRKIAGKAEEAVAVALGYPVSSEAEKN